MSGEPRGVLLDTCALIYLVNREPIRDGALQLILDAASRNAVLVSPISAWEVGLLSRPGSTRSQPSFKPDPRTWFATALAQPGVVTAPFTPEIAIDASHLPEPLHSDPADRLLIATARRFSLPLVTSDARILTYAASGHLDVIAC